MRASIEIVGTGPRFDRIVRHMVEHADEWREQFGFEIRSIAVRDLGNPNSDRGPSTADFIMHVGASEHLGSIGESNNQRGQSVNGSGGRRDHPRLG